MKHILTLLLLTTLIALPAVAEKPAKKKTSTKQAAKAQAGRTVSLVHYNSLLAGLGSIASSNLYLSYWSLNTLSDNTDKNLYDFSVAKTLVVTYHNLIQKAMGALLDVRNTSVDTTDRVFLTKMLYAYNDVDSSARTLIRYYDTKDSSTIKTYKQIHAESWKKISDLFGLAPKNTPSQQPAKK